MGPEEAHELGDTLLTLRKEFGLTIVMIDHHVPLVTRVSDYVYCLNFGEVLAEGHPDVVRHHPEVVRAYMGEDAAPGPDDTAVIEPVVAAGSGGRG
jgi:branched-chain amino acid transport system ATP-binding protein